MHKHPFKIAAMICALNEEEYIEYAIQQVIGVVDDIIVVLGTKPWNWKKDVPFEYDKTEQIVRRLGQTNTNIHILWAPVPVFAKDKNDAKACQNAQRQIALDKIKQLYPNEKYRYCFWLDADEFYTKEGLEKLLQIVDKNKEHYNSFSVPFRFYWRSFQYKLVFKEPVRRVNRVFRVWDDTHYRVGKYNKISSAPPSYEINPQEIKCHHMTTCRTEESMRFKILTRAYAEGRETRLLNWYNNVFLEWPNNKNMVNLHPTHPPVYKKAVYVDLDKEDFPTILKIHPYYEMEVIK